MKYAFEWDLSKSALNELKHGVSFQFAQRFFYDDCRVVAYDIAHSKKEERYYCFGKVDNEILTVRFTMRADVIRIFGAGYWRKGKAVYEKENNIH